MTNIGLAWNTVYIQKIFGDAKSKNSKEEGYDVNEEDLNHISPASFDHINRLGKYNFKDEIKLEGNGLRALRKPKNGRFNFKKTIYLVRKVKFSPKCYENLSYAMLSMGVAGFIGETLVLTFPGSKNGVEEYMDALFPQLLHVFGLKIGQKH